MYAVIFVGEKRKFNIFFSSKDAFYITSRPTVVTLWFYKRGPIGIPRLFMWPFYKIQFIEPNIIRKESVMSQTNKFF
jgi:hypothetical protein